MAAIEVMLVSLLRCASGMTFSTTTNIIGKYVLGDHDGSRQKPEPGSRASSPILAESVQFDVTNIRWPANLKKV
jgi:hypothetical protein